MARSTSLFILLLFIWLSVNILQGIFTEIGNDEAYYWMYSQHPAWGYFDHPPMVALFIGLGNILFDYELGVRVITIIAQIISLFLLWKIIGDNQPSRQKIIRFFGLAAAIPLFQVYGFITTPDAPLLLFTTVFLFVYKRFLSNTSIQTTLLLGLSMAALVYSKYHGLLIIMFTLVANHKLLWNLKFWLAGSIAIALFIPHLVWQANNQFPSFHYHMSDRVSPVGKFSFFEYWINQAVAFNPLILFLAVWIFTKGIPKEIYQRTLYVIVVGVFIFFWINTFMMRVEPHWTAVASIPLIIILYQNTSISFAQMKFVRRYVFPSLLLLLLARFAVIFDFLPYPVEFLHQKSFAEKIKKKAGTLPVVFINSYQKPSVYSFYTGEEAFTLNNIYYRQNQFDLWNYEESWQGKKVGFYSIPSDSLHINWSNSNSSDSFFIEEHLFSVQKLKVRYTLPDNINFDPGNEIRLAIEVFNPYPHPIKLNSTSKGVTLSVVFRTHDDIRTFPVTTDPQLDQINPGETAKHNIHFTVPELPPGEFSFAICFSTELLPEAFNSPFQKIKVSHRK